MVSSAHYESFDALKRQHGVYMETALVVLIWLIASPLVMTGIKTLTSSPELSFPYPWMLVGFLNFGTWFLCHTLRVVPGLMPQVDDNTVVPWVRASALGLLQGLEVGICADILHRLSLTVRTEINMLCPAFMFMFGVVAGIEPLDPRLMLAVSALTLGGLLASYGTMTWEGVELVPFALLASVFSSLRWVLVQKWLMPFGARTKPHPVALALRVSPMTSAVGFLVAAVREPGAYAGLLHLPFPEKVAGLLFAISVGVLLLMVAEMRVVQLTSALLLAFLVPFHNVSVILLDAAMKGARVSGINWMGIVLCALATGCYSAARKKNKDQSSVPLPFTGPSYQSAATGEAVVSGRQQCQAGHSASDQAAVC